MPTLPFEPPARRSPRTQGDPDKYIRRVKGGKFQARPHDEGVRYNLGLFPTIGEARRAVAEFWWGRFPARLRFARPVRDRAGRVTWIACVRVPARGTYPTRKNPAPGPAPGEKLETVRLDGVFATAKDAHAAAAAWLRENLGMFAALWVEGRAA